MPPTLDVRMFVLTVALLPLYLFAAKKVVDRITRRANSSTAHKREAWAVIALGIAYIVLMASQLRLVRWDHDAFAALFTWFCAHGVPALLAARATWAVVRSVRARTGHNTSARDITPREFLLFHENVRSERELMRRLPVRRRGQALHFALDGCPRRYIGLIAKCNV